jgi:adenosylcobinamide kinase/adenosylcobinamide-phosphate guanylyltransferase
MLDDLIRVSNERSGLTILVTNEVGSGIVPISFLGRRFRDLLGFVNQKLVENADRSFFIVAGKKIPLDDLDYDIAD